MVWNVKKGHASCHMHTSARLPCSSPLCDIASLECSISPTITSTASRLASSSICRNYEPFTEKKSMVVHSGDGSLFFRTITHFPILLLWDSAPKSQISPSSEARGEESYTTGEKFYSKYLFESPIMIHKAFIFHRLLYRIWMKHWHKIINDNIISIYCPANTLLCTGTWWKAGEALPGVAHTGPHYHHQEQCQVPATEYHSTDTHTLQYRHTT